MNEKTLGEIYCGVNFNPSGNPQVDLAKKLCAQLTDLTIGHYELNFGNKETENGFFAFEIYKQALADILNAQMKVVKLLTFK